MRMVREFPNMAVSIMRELAHRLERRTTSCATARSAGRELPPASRSITAGPACRHEPARQLYPPPRGAARLPRPRRRTDRRTSTGSCSNWGSATAAPTTICARSCPTARSMSATARSRRTRTACRRRRLILGDMRRPCRRRGARRRAALALLRDSASGDKPATRSSCAYRPSCARRWRPRRPGQRPADRSRGTATLRARGSPSAITYRA